MQVLQGHVTPVQITSFLIVNPPSWFGTVWSTMKKMLTVEFQQKVHMIPESRMPQFLSPGFEQLLPDEMASGRMRTDDLVRDWIRLCKFLEGHDEMEESSRMLSAIRQGRRGSVLKAIAGIFRRNQKNRR